jgi:hypothetical protein
MIVGYPRLTDGIIPSAPQPEGSDFFHRTKSVAAIIGKFHQERWNEGVHRPLHP